MSMICCGRSFVLCFELELSLAYLPAKLLRVRMWKVLRNAIAFINIVLGVGRNAAAQRFSF